MTLSSLATTRVEDVAAARRSPSDPLWLQLYVFKDRSITESFVKRAEASGMGGGVACVMCVVRCGMCDVCYAVWHV